MTLKGSDNVSKPLRQLPFEEGLVRSTDSREGGGGSLGSKSTVCMTESWSVHVLRPGLSFVNFADCGTEGARVRTSTVAVLDVLVDNVNLESVIERPIEGLVRG